MLAMLWGSAAVAEVEGVFQGRIAPPWPEEIYEYMEIEYGADAAKRLRRFEKLAIEHASSPIEVLRLWDRPFAARRSFTTRSPRPTTFP